MSLFFPLPLANGDRSKLEVSCLSLISRVDKSTAFQRLAGVVRLSEACSYPGPH